MSTQIIPQAVQRSNSPAVQQAILASRVIETQVGNRYATAVDLIKADAVVVAPDGVITVAGRYHITHSGCDCNDARFDAPLVNGRKACAHQVAGWIALKAARIAAQPPTAQAMTLAQIMQAATIVNGVPYVLQPTHIGGHGYAQIVQATEDPQAHEIYLVCGDWREDALFVAQWGANWGKIDSAAMGQLLTSLVSPSKVASQIAAQPLAIASQPVIAYYLETSHTAGIKIMVANGRKLPKCLYIVAGPDRLTQAAAWIEARAGGMVDHWRQTTPAVNYELRRSLLPARWRTRMGGDQVGKAWIIYASAPVA